MVKINLKETQNAIDNLAKIDREDYGCITEYIVEEAEEESYQNDKELQNMLLEYRDDEQALSIINETLICLCGWSIRSIAENVIQNLNEAYGDDYIPWEE